MGNLVKNNDEIIVSINYIVYANNNNTSNFSSAGKRDLNKIPWLNSSSSRQTPNEYQFQNANNNIPDFINKNKETKNVNEVIDMSDNAESTKSFFFF